MRQPGAGDRADALRENIERGGPAADLAAQRDAERDGRIEMRAGDRRQREDQHDQHTRRRGGVAEERERGVVRQPLRHDAGADDTGHQQTGAERLRDAGAAKISHGRYRRHASSARDGRASRTAGR